MDPNEALGVIRIQLSAFYAESADVPEYDETAFADAVAALDEWMSNGGFPPVAWRRGR